jgi:hypothetical protein
MLNRPEKEYYLALAALRQKEYIMALAHFDRAGEFFKNNREFTLLYETTKTLIAVKEQLAQSEEIVELKEL